MESKECGWCGCLVTVGMMENHRAWHVRLEPNLQTPTTKTGFWDPNTGEWNATSRDW